MRSSKYHLYLTDSEYSSIINALINLKNALTSQSKYTDGVNDLLLKFAKTKKKLVKIIYQ